MQHYDFFETAQERFFEFLNGKSSNNFGQELLEACKYIEDEYKERRIAPSKAIEIGETVNIIRECSKTFIAIGSQTEEVAAATHKEASAILNDFSRYVHFDKNETRSKSYEGTWRDLDNLNTRLFRRWFVEHIAYPYPDTETKHSLVDETNALIEKCEARGRTQICGLPIAHPTVSYEQCQLWFINARKRSQWTQFKSDYALSDQRRMHELATVLSSNDFQSDQQVNEKLASILVTNQEDRDVDESAKFQDRVRECREAWTSMIDFLEQRVKEQTGDWLDMAIQEAKAEYKQDHARLKEERRLIRDHQEVSCAQQAFDEEHRNTRRGPGRQQRRKPSNTASRSRKSTKIVNLTPANGLHRPSTRRTMRNVSGGSDSSKENAAIKPQHGSAWSSAESACVLAPQSPLQAYSRPATGALAAAMSSGLSLHQPSSFSDVQENWTQSTFAVPPPSWEDYIVQQQHYC